MKKLFFILSVILSVLVVSCSSRYIYHEKPTPIKKGVTKYFLKSTTVNLTLGDGAIEGDKSFVDKDGMTNQFKKYLIQHLTDKKILSPDEASADANLDIIVNFLRIYNWGGKALNKPHYGYSADVKKNGKLLVSYGIPMEQFTFGNKFADFPYNLKISAFQSGAADEERNVDYISERISQGILEIGD